MTLFFQDHQTNSCLQSTSIYVLIDTSMGFLLDNLKKMLQIHYAQNFVRPLFPFGFSLISSTLQACLIIWFPFHFFNITSIKLNHFNSIYSTNQLYVTTKCKWYMFDILKCCLTNLCFFLSHHYFSITSNSCSNCIIWYSIHFLFILS